MKDPFVIVIYQPYLLYRTVIALKTEWFVVMKNSWTQ